MVSGPTHPFVLPTITLIIINMTKYFFSGGVCCYNGCDLGNITVGCEGSGECICLTNQHCCALGAAPFTCGKMVPNVVKQEYMKAGLYCCTCGVKNPENLCALSEKVLCCVQVQSLPFDNDYVKKPIAGLFCVKCYPDFEVGGEYPSGGILANIMSR